MATLDIPSRLSFVGTVRPGNTIEARWIVGHPMETGFRVDDAGQRITRNVITQVRVLVNDKLVLDVEPGTGMSANPYLAFPIVVPADGGTVTVEWLDDAGRRGHVRQSDASDIGGFRSGDSIRSTNFRCRDGTTASSPLAASSIALGGRATGAPMQPKQFCCALA